MKIIILFFIFILTSTALAGATGEVLGDVAKGSAVGAAASFGGQKLASTVAPEFTKDLGKFMGSPPGIMILAGIGGANSAILHSAAADQEKESTENIKKIERILASFKDSYANFCPNGREKLEEPSCYCYLDNGKQNTNRSNSQICQKLWEKNKYIYDTTAGNYAGNGIVDPAGCLTVKGEFDENCNCKKLINSAGKNACMKTVSVNLANNALGAAYLKESGFDKVMTNLAQTASGNPNLNTLNPFQLGMAIAKQGDLNNRLFENLQKDPNRKNWAKNGSEIERHSRALFTKKNLDSLARVSGAPVLGASSSASLSPEQSKLLKDVQKKMGLELVGGSGLNKGKDDKKGGGEFNFMDAPAGGGEGGQLVQNFPEKNYKYKNSDIVTDQGASIFEIISNRYVESGLRRLFEVPEEEAKK